VYKTVQTVIHELQKCRCLFVHKYVEILLHENVSQDQFKHKEWNQFINSMCELIHEIVCCVEFMNLNVEINSWNVNAEMHSWRECWDKFMNVNAEINSWMGMLR
jgi:hypothetical protein